METMMITLTVVLSGVLSMGAWMVARTLQANKTKEQRLRAFVAR